MNVVKNLKNTPQLLICRKQHIAVFGSSMLCLYGSLTIICLNNGIVFGLNEFHAIASMYQYQISFTKVMTSKQFRKVNHLVKG